MIHQAAEALLDSLQSAAGRSISYTRGLTTIALMAVPGVRQFQPATAEQFVEELSPRDFLIRASELILSGSQTEPQVGDTISESFGVATHTYAVMALDGNPFRYADSEKTILRVFTKRIS